MAEHDLLSMPTCRGVNVQALPIAKLQAHMAAGTFSAGDLAGCYLERIKRVNSMLKAIIEVNPDVGSIAAERDDERRRGFTRGPLHGIPFVVKDNIATHDKMQTTAGSRALVGTVVPEDALVVTKLREAGAVLLGHANLSEWACMRSSYYSEAYSGRGGQCRNPHNLAQHPGGSSCGSAVAVAASMCAFGLATETDGSIIYPADRNGVVGLKPTVGATSGRGIIPESRNLDVVGAITTTVADTALVTSAVVGQTVEEGPGTPFESFLADKSALRGARFGMPRKRLWDAAAGADMKKFQYETLQGVVERIREAGAVVTEDTDISSGEDIIAPDKWNWNYPSHPPESELTVVKTDFYNDIRDYLATLTTNPHNFRSLEDIIAFNREHADQEGGIPGRHPAWPTGQDVFEQSVATGGREDETYNQALEFIRRKSKDEGIDGALGGGGEGQLDGLIVPVQAESGLANQVAAKAGYPMITIPVGRDKNGVPFGLALIHTAGREDLLVRYGSAIEDLVGLRPIPEFRNPEADNYMYVGVKPEWLA